MKSFLVDTLVFTVFFGTLGVAALWGIVGDLGLWWVSYAWGAFGGLLWADRFARISRQRPPSSIADVLSAPQSARRE